MRGVPFSNTGMEKSISDPSIPGSEPRMFQAQLCKKRFQDWGKSRTGRGNARRKKCAIVPERKILSEKKVELFTRLS